MIEEDGRVPVLDTGVVARIRAGDIRIRGAIKRFAPQLVVFEDGAPETFDAVILATGFKPDLRSLLPDVRGVLDFERSSSRERPADRAAWSLFCWGSCVAHRPTTPDQYRSDPHRRCRTTVSSR